MNTIRHPSREYLLVRAATFTTIFISGGVYLVDPSILAGLDLVLLCALYINGRIPIHRAMYTPLCILLALFVYVGALSRNMEDIGYVVSRSIQFALAFGLVNYFVVKRESWMGVLDDVLIVFLAHGIVNCIVTTLLGPMFVHTTTRLGSNLNAFLVFFYGSHSVDMLGLGIAIHRNQGLFGEPGIFQIYMNVLFFINLFVCRNYRVATLASVMVLSTFSTAGYIILLLQLFVFIQRECRSSRLRTQLLLLGSLPFLVGLGVYSYQNIYDKFFGANRGSFTARDRDTRTGLGLLWKEPWGIGFSTQKYIKVYQNSNPNEYIDYERGNLNSIIRLFSSVGVIWGCVFIYYMYRQQMVLTYRLLHFIILTASLCCQPLLYTPCFLIFPISGMLGRRYSCAISRSYRSISPLPKQKTHRPILTRPHLDTWEA